MTAGCDVERTPPEEVDRVVDAIWAEVDRQDKAHGLTSAHSSSCPIETSIQFSRDFSSEPTHGGNRRIFFSSFDPGNLATPVVTKNCAALPNSHAALMRLIPKKHFPSFLHRCMRCDFAQAETLSCLVPEWMRPLPARRPKEDQHRSGLDLCTSERSVRCCAPSQGQKKWRVDRDALMSRTHCLQAFNEIIYR